MSPQSADVVICGAGIAGISAAYHLAAGRRVGRVLLVDERAPLTLTSDKSSECYRNWWPGLPAMPGASGAAAMPDAMVRLMDRSIDIMEALARESGNMFQLNRRGYLYVTADPAGLPALQREAEEISALGAGPLRLHAGQPGEETYSPAPAAGFAAQPAGADLITDRALLHEHFPYLAESVVAVLHVRRAGWLSAQQLGMYLLEQGRACGVELVRARVTGVELWAGRVAGVRVAPSTGGEETVATGCFVNAAGPWCAAVARLAGLELPVFAELHAKVAIVDTLGAVPRGAPLLIWAAAQRLEWSADEEAAWRELPGRAWLLDELPPGAHVRPEGGPGSRAALMLWAYHTPAVDVVWPPAFDPLHAEIVLRGLAPMLPALRGYLGRLPRPSVDGGYYLKTRENRPLICRLPVPGAYLIGALSGFGVMAACAAGELLASCVDGSDLPGYAPAFALERYNDPVYLDLLARGDATGQL